MREMGPRLLPGAPGEHYIVVNHYGRFGTAFAENRSSTAPTMRPTVADLRTAMRSATRDHVQIQKPTDSEDVSHAVAQEVLRCLGMEGRGVPTALEDFIDRHVGPWTADSATGAGIRGRSQCRLLPPRPRQRLGLLQRLLPPQRLRPQPSTGEIVEVKVPGFYPAGGPRMIPSRAQLHV